MESLENFMLYYEDRELVEHLKIDINYTTMLLEKYGLFDGCSDIVSKIVNAIKDKYLDNERNFDLKYTAKDFEGVKNLFFNELIVKCTYLKLQYSEGEYIGKEDNIKDGKLDNVTIDVTYTNLDWKSLAVTMTHELTHAFEDWNRSRKEGVKTLKDIETQTYKNAVDNLTGFNDNVNDLKKLVAFYIYLGNKSELNAYIASFSEEVNSMHATFDLTQQDVIKEALAIIRKTSAYRKYKELDNAISNIDRFDSKVLRHVYNDITSENKTALQIKKEMKSNWKRIMNKLNSTIPKIVCDFIDKNVTAKTIERKIPDRIFVKEEIAKLEKENKYE